MWRVVVSQGTVWRKSNPGGLNHHHFREKSLKRPYHMVLQNGARRGRVWNTLAALERCSVPLRPPQRAVLPQCLFVARLGGAAPRSPGVVAGSSVGGMGKRQIRVAPSIHKNQRNRIRVSFLVKKMMQNPNVTNVLRRHSCSKVSPVHQGIKTNVLNRDVK